MAVEQRQDGLHNILTSEEFQAVLMAAVQSAFGPLVEPDFLEELRRFVQKGRRNDSRSYAVGVEPPAAGAVGRQCILPRDESRVRAFVFNNGGQTVFLGGRQVTAGGVNDASGGIPLAAAQGMWIDGTVGELYAVSTQPGQDVRVLDLCGTLA